MLCQMISDLLKSCKKKYKEFLGALCTDVPRTSLFLLSGRRPHLLPLASGSGQEASQRPEWSGGRRQDSPAVQHHQLRPGRVLHHPGPHLPEVPAHRLLRPHRAPPAVETKHWDMFVFTTDTTWDAVWLGQSGACALEPP